ncbi:MAG: pyridoxal phosphate-dependent aminotransferase [Chloracidobacterium sp.]|nr:pyridoxal phosphate-dependent aminotransferase [Chloracidobacterium sp.]
MADQFKVSDNVAKMRASSTLRAAQIASALREEGHDVIDLTVGEPDFDTPDFIKQFASEGLQKGLTRYTASAGTRQFTEAVAAFYAEQFGTSFSPSEVAAACGGKQALFNAACTLLNPGDDVLIPRPYWVTFPEIAAFCRANAVYVDTEATGFILTADEVRSKITDRSRLLIINSPNNPSGRVIPGDEIRRIIETCAELGVYVLADECYLFFAYPPGEVFSSASFPAELREFVCVAGSFSKTFAMTGWRIGYTIANEAWTKAMVKLQSHSATHPTSFVQYACARAMEDPERSMTAVRQMLAEYERRRDWLIPALNTIEGFKCDMPEGAFYAFVDVRDMLGGKYARSADVVEAMLTEAYVATTDGAGFGADGFIRFSYATSMDNLKAAVDRLHTLFGTRSATAA